MQVELKQINAVTKEVNLIVETERADKAYKKYLNKAARDVQVPGFRKGKAPLSMVERMHADTIRDYFMKDIVDEVFEEAVKEHDIHFLLYPEVKDIVWEPGSEMKIVIEIEHEPDVEFKQTEGLRVPYTPVSLEDEAMKYIKQLTEENAKVIDVETAEENDMVTSELSFDLRGTAHTYNAVLFAGEKLPQRSFKELLGAKTGDTLDINISGNTIKLTTKQNLPDLDNDTEYPCKVMVNSVTRYTVPTIDDDFAKDMEFDSLDEMKAKIMADLQTRVEHQNINGENFAVISKLYVDNRYDLPHRTIEYLAEKEVERLGKPEWKQYYEYQIKMQIAQEMISLYTMNNLKKMIDIEITDEMIEEYIEHEAILEDKSVGAYKETHKDFQDSDDFKEAVKNYFILRKLSATSEFHIPDPEEEHEGHEHIEDAQIVEEGTQATIFDELQEDK
ncbi:MAG: trigger factor [Candidatus Cloacimonadaceae bacterium]|nr:trigger factor [Candidatus Cloacimonadaceae bacterium]